MNIVLLGAIASGKGTLAQNLEKKYGFVQISTGDLFRNLSKQNTPLAREVQALINGGNLVPDEITVKILLEELEKHKNAKGIILDGFPRTKAQARAMEGKIDVDAAVLINVPNDIIFERLATRRVCPKCNKVYNTSWHKSDLCECGSQLIARKDDADKDAILKRINTFETQTGEVIDYFKSCNKLLEIDGSKSGEETLKSAEKVLNLCS